MDLDTLAYFLYMDDCERREEQKKREKEAAAVREYKASFEELLETDRGTKAENKWRF